MRDRHLDDQGRSEMCDHTAKPGRSRASTLRIDARSLNPPHRASLQTCALPSRGSYTTPAQSWHESIERSRFDRDSA
jgi:hypothetical protein